MIFERKTQFAGTLIYQPRTTLSAETIAKLRHSLIQTGLLQEPENPAVVIDWVLEARDADGIIAQRYIVLYRDGGDSEEPACVFYRKDVYRRENRTVEFLHMPSQEDQPRLTAAWKWFQDPDGPQLKILTNYLDTILGDDSRWQPLSPEGS